MCPFIQNLPSHVGGTQMGAHLLKDKVWLRGSAPSVWLWEYWAGVRQGTGLVLPPQAPGNEEVWANNTNLESNLILHLPLSPPIFILLLLLKALIALNQQHCCYFHLISDDFCSLGASGNILPVALSLCSLSLFAADSSAFLLRVISSSPTLLDQKRLCRVREPPPSIYPCSL